MKLFKTVPEFFMAIYLFLQLPRYNSIKLIEKLSRQDFINSFDNSEVLRKL